MKPMISVFSSIQQKRINREMNDEEFAQYELDQKTAADAAKAAEEAAAAKSALLAKLGITEDEAKLLLS